MDEITEEIKTPRSPPYCLNLKNPGERLNIVENRYKMECEPLLTEGKTMATTLNKLEALKEAYPDDAELERVLAKLLDVALSSQRLRLERYNRDLGEFEQRYAMESSVFYKRFESGELGDPMDFFEWAGLYELRENLLEKIRRMEEAF